MKPIFKRIQSRALAFAHDVLMIPAAWFGAYWLRFNLETVPDEYFAKAINFLPLVLALQLSTFWYFGLYRGIWRFASVPDLVRIGKAVATGTISIVFVVFLTIRMEGMPRAIFPLYAVLLIGFLGGPRLIYRWLKDRHLYLNSDAKRVLVVGAGHGGEMLIRDILRQSAGGYIPVALVDDRSRQQGREMHGVRVMGTCEEIPELARRMDIQLILIAIPSATSRDLRRIVGFCERSGVPFRILPRYQDLVSGIASVKELRDVQIEDLLGREKVSLDWHAIGSGMSGRRILVTGGGGSIGAELCRQIARLKPESLIVFEQSEYNLYRIDLELKQKWPAMEFIGVLGDINDPVLSQRTFEIYRPDIVFHAAAYKHVPMLEGQLRAAVRNNIFGTRSIAELSVRYGTLAFVLISSDKAVNPGNIMGTTKRVAEMCCELLQNSGKTRFVTVRFGNVLGSAGSVIPLFQQQIAAGGPVTVTDPEVTRYFMTIPEACQLIMQASVIGKGGEIYVLDMGEPVKIRYLAEQLIVLSGRKPGEDIEIVYTGLRPGEKVFEELFHNKEQFDRTQHSKIFLARARAIDAGWLGRTLGELQSACDAADENRLRELMQLLVPESSIGPNISSRSSNSSVRQQSN